MFLNRVIILTLILVGATSSHAYSKVDESKISWPGEQWEVSSPEIEGVGAEAIKEIVEGIESGLYGSVDHFLVIKNGRIIADHKYSVNYDELLASNVATEVNNSPIIHEQYNYDDTRWHPFFNGGNLHTLQSVTKSITSAAFGIAIDEGLIKDVNQPIYPYFKNFKYDMSDPRKSEITIEDLLTMRTGIDWFTDGGYDNNNHSTVVMENSDNWLQYILDRPMDKKPGTSYEYNDGSSVLLGKILSEATGVRADEWAKKKLFTPIGIHNFKWKITPKGETDTEGGLYLSTYDLARIAYLFLREGQWKGKQIVSKAWVQKSVSAIVENINPDNDKGSPGYGYQWYSKGKGESSIYLGAGYGGQYIVVSPKFDIVMVFNSWSVHKKSKKNPHKVLEDIIIPAIQEQTSKKL